MDPHKFVNKWKAAELKERSAAQEHWIDVCRMIGQPTPAEHDKTGTEYCFERGAQKTTGGDGWADVWWSSRFAVEYKGKRKDLARAYDQLLLYRESLENPPLLIVIDLDRFEVHTNFTGTAKRIFKFNLDDIAGGRPVKVETTESTPPSFTAIEVLRYAFTDQQKLKPTVSSEYITKEASAGFARIAESMRARGIEPHVAAHFLMKCLFCLFAEDIELLPEKVFERSVSKAKKDPDKLADHMGRLFAAMKDGGEFALETIPWFNGGLFDDAPPIEMTADEIENLLLAGKLDWSDVEPSIFGTLFERSLDPGKRSQLGAHYTSREDIMLVVEPVILRPMRREWEAIRPKVNKQVERYNKAAKSLETLQGKSKKRASEERKVRDSRKKIQKLYADLLEKFHNIRILDPACGSGNFLYVALSELKDMEKAILQEAYSLGVGLTKLNPLVEPGQLYGIEINAYAHELAQVVVWIGYIQWHIRNGYKVPREPILKPLDNIKQMDALLERSASVAAVPAAEPASVPLAGGVGETPTPHAGQRPTTRRPKWPEADFIIGNPPFLGGKLLRSNLGDEYVDTLFKAYDGDVAREADLSVYWHERARALIEAEKVKRAGLLATQGIRGGANQKTLKRILETGNIFDAWSDRNWVLDGATVHVSIVCQDTGRETVLRVDGLEARSVTPTLRDSAGGDLSSAKPLEENSGLCFQGPVVVGPFDVPDDVAHNFLDAPNPHGESNADVVFPVCNAADLTRRSRGRWIIDFQTMTKADAALYELPFEYVREHVRPKRLKNRDKQRRENWWRHGRAGTALKRALVGKSRQIASPRVAKHRLFVFLPPKTIVTDAVVSIARDDVYFFGVLHSVAHERWALRMGTQLREKESGARYTPTTCFETFPFPWPPRSAGSQPAQAVGAPPTAASPTRAGGKVPPARAGEAPALRDADETSALQQGIASAARELNELREEWLNPPNLTEAELKKRTLTNLYNKRPEWLHLAHLKLDRAVFKAYAWDDLNPEDLYATIRPGEGESIEQAKTRQKQAEEEMLKRLLALNHERA